jgi:hypothetical protein
MTEMDVIQTSDGLPANFGKEPDPAHLLRFLREI